MPIYFFVITISIYLTVFFVSRQKYLIEVKGLDRKEFALKELMSVGLWVLDYSKYSYKYRYDQKLLIKIVQLRGYKNARYFLRIHWANKINLIILLIMFCIFILSIIQTIDIAFLGFYIGVIIVVFFVIDKEIDRKINKRHMLLQYDFPEFVNKLVLLINAGLGVSRAWVKILTDSNSKSPLYDELKIVLLKLESGKSEQSAYEEFARSCRIPEITKFVSILIQHSKKGNSDLVTALRLQAFECWQMRKNIARRLGEEASVKMIFPLMIMFIAVLMIVAAPAVIFIIF